MRAARLPDQFCWIASQERIGRKQRPTLFQALSDQNAVEKIAVVHWQVFKPSNMIQDDGEHVNVVICELLAQEAKFLAKSRLLKNMEKPALGIALEPALFRSVKTKLYFFNERTYFTRPSICSLVSLPS